MIKEVVFKTRVDTGNSVKDLEKLNNTINETSQTVENIGRDFQSEFDKVKASVDSGELSMRQMTKAVKAYQSIAIQAGENTPIGEKAIREAGELRDRIGDLNQRVNFFANDTRNLQASLELGQTVTAGYGALQGTFELLGVSSNTLQQSMVKLQAVETVLQSIEVIRNNTLKESALVQGLLNARTVVATTVQTAYSTAVGTSTGVMKALRASMLALPLLALVAGITLVIGALNAMGDASEKTMKLAEDAIKRQNQLFDDLGRSFDNQNKKEANELEAMKARGEDKEKIYKKELENIEALEARRAVLQSERLVSIKQFEEQYKRALNSENKEEADALAETIGVYRKAYKDLKDQKVDLEQKKLITQLNYQKQTEEETEKNNEKLLNKERVFREAMLNLQRRMEDLRISLIPDDYEREKAELDAKHQRELQDELARFEGTKEQRLLFKQQLEELQKEENAVLEIEQRRRRDTELADEAIALSEQAKVRRDSENQEREITRSSQQIQMEAWKAYNDDLVKKQMESEAIKQQAIQATINKRISEVELASSTLKGLSQLFEKGSKAQKGFAKASIIADGAVNSIKAIQGAQQAALATGPAYPVAFPLIAGVQVALIAKQTNDALKAVGGGGVTPPNINAGSQTQTFVSTKPTETAQAKVGNNTSTVLVVESVTQAQENVGFSKSVATVIG